MGFFYDTFVYHRCNSGLIILLPLGGLKCEKDIFINNPARSRGVYEIRDKQSRRELKIHMNY